MKIKKRFIIGMALIAIFAVAIFLISHQSVIIYKSKDTLGIDNMFSNIAGNVYANYKDGRYGQELYYLASGGGWGGIGDIAIYQNIGTAQIIFYQNNKRYKKRTLTPTEYQDFLSFIEKNQIDTLTDWDSHMVLDGIEYQYIHIYENKTTTFYMNNPDSTSKHPIYQTLIDSFFSLTETGIFEIRYTINGNEDRARVLIPNEEYKVESVWRDDNDFRVMINEDNNFVWYSFENGKLLEQVAEPDGFSLQNAWKDIPDDYIYHDHINNYPWQVSWNSYCVRMIHKPHGLYLTKENAEPILISDNLYGNPVVIPNTNWVVCSRAEKGWAYPNDIMKIDLETFEEFTLDLSASDTLYPIVYINGKVLIAREKAQYSFEYFLYDAQTDKFEAIKGDFTKLDNNLRERFLQASLKQNEYYCTTRGDGTTIGTFNFDSYKFKRMAHFDELHFDSMDMWIDEQDSVLYLVINHDLLAISL